jgi:hypothetical protein
MFRSAIAAVAAACVIAMPIAASADEAVDGTIELSGGSVAAMENQNGVVIKLRSANQGLQFNLSVEGVAFAVTR